MFPIYKYEQLAKLLGCHLDGHLDGRHFTFTVGSYAIDGDFHDEYWLRTVDHTLDSKATGFLMSTEANDPRRRIVEEYVTR